MNAIKKVSLVLTVIGPDMPGLVSRLSDTAANHQANWLGARMANLAGQFAGIVHFEVPAVNEEALDSGLRELESSGMRVMITRGRETGADSGSDLLRLELVGQDHPGIVRDISRVLADRGVSIEDLVTRRVSGAFSGDDLFQATVQLRVPESVVVSELRQGLEALAHQLMVDLTLDDGRSL